MSIEQSLDKVVIEGMKSLYDVDIPSIEIQETRKEFKGDLTVVVFPFLRFVKGNPIEIATKLGAYVSENLDVITDFNVVKGFLNLSISNLYFIKSFANIYAEENYGVQEVNEDLGAVMVEYSSPNTNKPLHLGHIRNNLLGYSVAEIIGASGRNVYKTQIINDRGIHICKSMIAWEKFGNNESPESSGLKGDKLVGKYYVAFDKQYKEEISELISSGKSEEEAKKMPLF